MNTLLLDGGKEKDIELAGQLLRDGFLVAIPTETVYGLAANATDENAVASIFVAKGRPADNPLIVHISCLEQIYPLCSELGKNARILAEHFWPGPMTMLLKKSPLISDIVTAGLDSVGIRMPSHPMAQAIINASGCPLAAPSANTSGRPSPTTAAHVIEDMQGKISAIVDGGACSVGVESTVVDMTCDTPNILRPGAITMEMIEAVLGKAQTDASTEKGLKAGEKPRAPGMKYRHYAPKAPVILLEGAPRDTAAKMAELVKPESGVICFSEYASRIKALQRGITVQKIGASCDFGAHARHIFSALRFFDGTAVDTIYAQCPRPAGNNAATVNRLRKAAGFNAIKCTEKQIIGVTGRSGSGKSSFCGAFAQRGGLILDADGIYKGLLKDSVEMINAIAQEFPSAVKNGVVDRKALAAIVFSDKRALLKLNALTHPAVKAAMQGAIGASTAKTILLDVPLLFESAIDELCTLTLGITAPKKAVIARVSARDKIDTELAKQRLNSQKSPAYYRSKCDIIIENNGTAGDFEKKILDFISKYVKL